MNEIKKKYLKYFFLYKKTILTKVKKASIRTFKLTYINKDDLITIEKIIKIIVRTIDKLILFFYKGLYNIIP